MLGYLSGTLSAPRVLLEENRELPRGTDYVQGRIFEHTVAPN